MSKKPPQGIWESFAVLLTVLMVVIATGFLSTRTAEARHPSCGDLHAAAFLDEPGELKGLLRHGADVNCLDALGHTPLVTAINGASFRCFTLLLDAGARVDVRTEYGKALLAHTRAKVASLNVDGAQNLQALYQKMVVRLKAAGAN